MTSELTGGMISHNYHSLRSKLHYGAWGDPSSPPLLLLHGERDHCRTWDWVASDLCKSFYVIAPDLRGHGDSQWSLDGNYSFPTFVYDIWQLIHVRKLAPLKIVGHSMGGAIALYFAGLYPEAVERMVVIEGLDLPPKLAEKHNAMTVDERFRSWISEKHAHCSSLPRRFLSVEEAMAQMTKENPGLKSDKIRHLAIHGTRQNEDGTYGWKYDSYIRPILPIELSEMERRHLFARITCPMLLIHGRNSWAPDPIDAGHLQYLKTARVEAFENSGHSVHHDQQARLISSVSTFMTLPG